MKLTSHSEIILEVQGIQSYITHYHILENVTFDVPKGPLWHFWDAMEPEKRPRLNLS